MVFHRGGVVTNVRRNRRPGNIERHLLQGFIPRFGRDIWRTAIAGAYHAGFDRVTVAHAHVAHHQLGALLHLKGFQVGGVGAGGLRFKQGRRRQFAHATADQHLGDL